MKKGDRVVIINPDSSFYNKKGVVTDIRGNQAMIFLREKKEQLVFLKYDIRVIKEKGDA